jgi:hypothetical protein
MEHIKMTNVFMEPEAVFFVSGLVRAKTDHKGTPKNLIVCSDDSDNVRHLLSSGRPDFEIISITSMQSYLNVLKLIKSNLNGESQEVDVYIDPEMREIEKAA